MTIGRRTIEKMSKILDRVDLLELENQELKKELDFLKEYNEKLIAELKECASKKEEISIENERLRTNAITMTTVLKEVGARLAKQVSKEEEILDLETKSLLNRIDRYA